MANKKGFLLLEILISFSLFVIFITIYLLFIYVELKTVKISAARSEGINIVSNYIEKGTFDPKLIKSNNLVVNFVVKPKQNLKFVVINRNKKVFSNLIQNTYFVGPLYG